MARTTARSAAIVALTFPLAACVGTMGDAGFTPQPGDEAVDPSDPPIDPDPDDPDELLAEPPEPGGADAGVVPADGVATAPYCRMRSGLLSPSGLTFVIHVSKNAENGAAALRQLRAVRHLIRARDVFVIERTSPLLAELRADFPCNRVDFIAYPSELADAYASLGETDGIAVDWESGNVWSHSQAWTVDRLRRHSNRIRELSGIPGVVPYWPSGFDDGHIVRASHMSYELAQIQNRCAHRGPAAFGDATRALVRSFRANGVSPRRLGVEISLDSYAFADNHTGVERSAQCTRAAYGKGGRAVYLYGNGHPHIAPFFRRIHEMGLRR